MTRMIRTPCPFAMLIATGALLLSQAAAQPQSPPMPKTAREWNALRNRARTAADCRALSQWSQSQAESCRRKQIDCEAELRDYYAHPSPHPFPRNPPRDQSLKHLIAYYQGQARRWDDLAGGYSEKAAVLEGTSAPPQRP